MSPKAKQNTLVLDKLNFQAKVGQNLSTNFFILSWSSQLTSGLNQSTREPFQEKGHGGSDSSLEDFYVIGNRQWFTLILNEFRLT